MAEAEGKLLWGFSDIAMEEFATLTVAEVSKVTVAVSAQETVEEVAIATVATASEGWESHAAAVVLPTNILNIHIRFKLDSRDLMRRFYKYLDRQKCGGRSTQEKKMSLMNQSEVSGPRIPSVSECPQIGAKDGRATRSPISGRVGAD